MMDDVEVVIAEPTAEDHQKRIEILKGWCAKYKRTFRAAEETRSGRKAPDALLIRRALEVLEWHCCESIAKHEAEIKELRAKLKGMPA